MPIQLICPQCRSPFAARDESAGRRVKCPACGAVLAVPAGGGSSPPAPTRPAEDAGPRGGGGPLTPLSTEEKSELRFDDPPKPTAPDPFRVRNDPEPPRRRSTAARSPAPAGGGGVTTFPDEEVSGWKAARRGLGRLQWAALLIMVPFVLECVNTVVSIQMENHELTPPEGFLNNIGFLAEQEIGSNNMYTDIVTVSQYVGLGLGTLLALFGCMACAGIPSKTSYAKGTAGWATFLLLLAIAGFGLLATMDKFYPEIADYSVWLPVGRIGIHVLFVCGIVANLMILQYVAQTGTYLGNAKAAKAPAGFLFWAGFWALVWFIGAPYVDIVQRQQFPELASYEPLIIPYYQDQLERSVATAVLMAVGIFLVAMSYVGMMSRLRRAIGKRLPQD